MRGRPIHFRFSVFLVLFLAGMTVKGQFSQRNFLEVADNQISGNAFSRLACLSEYKFGRFFSGGLGLGVFLPGATYSGGIQFTSQLRFEHELKRGDFHAEIFYRHLPASARVLERNAGILAGWTGRHFRFTLGNNWRIYSVREQARQSISGAGNLAYIIRENRNLLYRAEVWLRPIGHSWNAGFFFTDYDFFLMNQELNPRLCLRLTGALDEKVECFGDLWYQSAGFWNEQIDYFGYLVRIGFTWKI